MKSAACYAIVHPALNTALKVPRGEEGIEQAVLSRGAQLHTLLVLLLNSPLSIAAGLQ